MTAPRIGTTWARTRTSQHEVGWSLAAAATAVAVALVLHPFRRDVDAGTVALVLLAAPLLAALASLRAAVACACACALAFNYLFTTPYDSLAIQDDTSVVAFVMYLAIAIAVAIIVARMRRLAATSGERAGQALLLRDLTIDLVRQNVWLQPPLSSALDDLISVLRLEGAALSIGIPGGEQFAIGAGGAHASRAAIEALERHPDAGHGELPVMRLRTDGDVRVVPIATSTDAFGMLAVEPTPDRPLGDSEERLVDLFANVVAVACERAAYMQRSVQNKALEETDRLRTTLMQSVSHDLRTPLTSINALASALPDLGSLPEEQQQMLDDIVQQTDRLAHLVDQVLDVSRIESGNLTLRRQTVPLDDLVQVAVDAVRLTTGATISVALEPTPAIPIDEVLLKQAVVNLLENAIRYGEPPFEVVLQRRGALLELRIVDHGVGIAEAERRRLFDPNYAMRRSTTDARSRGLGLAISAGFVEAHDGHVRAEPTPGGGATFVISLPAGPRNSSGATS